MRRIQIFIVCLILLAYTHLYYFTFSGVYRDTDAMLDCKNLIVKAAASTIEIGVVPSQDSKIAKLLPHNTTEGDVTSENRNKTNYGQKKSFPRKPKLMFLKTHKSATSTLVNMLYLYGIRRKLNFVMKPYDHWLGEISQTIRVSELLQPRPGGCWEIQVTHGIFSAEGEHEVLPKNQTFYTTIIRSPATQVPSAFYYFGQEKRQRLKYGKKFSKSELIDKYLERANITPTDFLSPAIDLGWKRWSANMGYDMPVEDKINGFIEHMKEEMDLVMISERIDESLIVLKEYMEWKLDDILYLNRNIAPSLSKTNLTKSTIRNIYNHLTLDKQMFDFFNASLDRHIEKLGRKHINEEVIKFRKMRHEFENRCFDKTKVKVMEWDTRSYELTKYGKSENLACTFLQLNDVQLDDAISQLQNSRDYTMPIRYKGSLVTKNYIFYDLITTLQREFENRTVSYWDPQQDTIEEKAISLNVPRLW